VAAEELFEWFFNWIPLYYEAKFFFILWLVSPGTQGATYLYKTYLQPFYESNTQNIDAAIASAKTSSLGFVQSTIAAIWASIINRLTSAQAAGNQNADPAPGQPGNPAQNNVNEAINGLWKQWGPAVLSAGANILNPARNAAAAQPAVANPTGAPLTPRSVPTPAANTPTPESDQLRYRSSAVPDEGRKTPPPAFPTPQH
jgi:receptor expression-enhancing protein 1/2/3/4